MAFTLPSFTHSFRILDVHHHAGSVDGYFGLAGPAEDPRAAMGQDIETRLRFMDTWGIEQALLMPAYGQAAPRGIEDIRRYNDYVAEYQARRRDRFPLMAGCVNPQDGEDSVRELQRCLDALGMHAMSWHHRFQGCPINHPGMGALLEAMADKNAPALVHVIAESTLESPWRLEVIADRHPRVTFVALDAFSSSNQASWMHYIAERHPNIWFETGIMASVAHGLDRFVESVGFDRLLFGTDYYSSPKLLYTPFPLHEILAGPFADAAKEAIFGGNARRLFGL